MGEVIHFPNKGLLKNLNKKPKLSQEEISRIQLLNDKRTADQLSESLAIDILTVLQEHISDMQKSEFIADLAILIEVIKSTLYREHDLKHPIQEIIEKIATVKILQNGEKVTELNYRPILNKEEEGDIEIEFVPETD
tara:strand:- start:9 stop:419 length:411 start_codon:yes stop_codon:yes gene_type:complete